MPAFAPNSSFRGFVLPGTGEDLTLDDGALGFDASFWDSSPQSGQSLDDFMQQIVAGVTGIPQSLIRPRWQPEPPNTPPTAPTASNPTGVVPVWAAVGVTKSTPRGFPAITENPTGNGFSELDDREEFDVLCSFYGQFADAGAIALRSGLMVAQNRECLQLASMGLIQVSVRTRVPALMHMEFRERIDITASFRRR